MSTSESRKAPPISPSTNLPAALPGNAPALLAGLPDPEALARMAREFFTALPLTDVPESLAGRQAVSSIAPVGVLSEPQLRALPAGLAPSTAQAQIPAIPGSVTTLPS